MKDPQTVIGFDLQQKGVLVVLRPGGQSPEGMGVGSGHRADLLEASLQQGPVRRHFPCQLHLEDQEAPLAIRGDVPYSNKAILRRNPSSFYTVLKVLRLNTSRVPACTVSAHKQMALSPSSTCVQKGSNKRSYLIHVNYTLVTPVWSQEGGRLILLGATGGAKFTISAAARRSGILGDQGKRIANLSYFKQSAGSGLYRGSIVSPLELNLSSN